jgi:16S rRNA (uracil1498-N3)-methyltransferase
VTVPRIYSPVELDKEKISRLGRDNYKYLKQILRLEPGDSITIFDGFGHEFAARIRTYCADSVDIELGDIIERAGHDIKITLGQALPKTGKMDMIVRSAAELGADAIIPFAASRSVSRVSGEKIILKAARWQKIAREAARCCRGQQITEVLPIVPFETMLAQADSLALKIIFWEEEDQKRIKDILTDPGCLTSKDIFIVVGPEGGFSREEIFQATQTGFISVSLGKQILKVETAALAILSIIQYEKGIFSGTSGGKNDRL